MDKGFIWFWTKFFIEKIIQILGWIILVLVLFYILTTLVIRPSNDRAWNLDQEILPYAEVHGNLVNVHNIRNFTYASTTDYVPAYYDKVFDLSKLKRVYYVVEPFTDFVGAAHTFLSFEFEGDNFVAVSVEIRKEKGESFSALKGLFRQYELMYVIADERDVVKLRSNYRKDLVYVYPVKASPEDGKKLFLDIIERVNGLRYEPEFYNTLTNTCTTNIADHVNDITPRRIPGSLDILFPAASDRLALKLGLLDTDLPLEAARAKYLINDKALKYADDPMFAAKIRLEE
ncbi:MAG: DUF4105 domain-containing protein [Patescibacteria group bacterium]